MQVSHCIIYAVLFFFCLPFICQANALIYPVCEMVSPEQLAALYPSPLYPSQQKNGCRWSDKPNGRAYFQIGIIENSKNLRQFFEKQLPSGYHLEKIKDIGNRGLYTQSNGYLSVVAIRQGNWVLVSTVDLLYIKMGDGRQNQLWDIFRGILKSLK
ncbi:uncharacterized protein Dvar_48970 [Desulfosarcina variabilis str. Montpellier]